VCFNGDMNWNRDYAGKHSATGAEYAYTATRTSGAWRLAVLDGITLTAIAYHTERRLADIVAIAARHDAATDDERRSIRAEFRP